MKHYKDWHDQWFEQWYKDRLNPDIIRQPQQVIQAQPQVQGAPVLPPPPAPPAPPAGQPHQAPPAPPPPGPPGPPAAPAPPAAEPEYIAAIQQPAQDIEPTDAVVDLDRWETPQSEEEEPQVIDDNIEEEVNRLLPPITDHVIAGIPPWRDEEEKQEREERDAIMREILTEKPRKIFLDDPKLNEIVDYFIDDEVEQVYQQRKNKQNIVLSNRDGKEAPGGGIAWPRDDEHDEDQHTRKTQVVEDKQEFVEPSYESIVLMEDALPIIMDIPEAPDNPIDPNEPIQLPNWIEDESIQELLDAPLSRLFENEDSIPNLSLEERIKRAEREILDVLEKYKIKERRLTSEIKSAINSHKFRGRDGPLVKSVKKKQKPNIEDYAFVKLQNMILQKNKAEIDRVAKYVYGMEKNRPLNDQPDNPDTEINESTLYPVYTYQVNPVLPDWFPTQLKWTPRIKNMALTKLAYFQIMCMCHNRNDYWRVNSIIPTKWLMFNKRWECSLDPESMQLTTMPWGKCLLFQFEHGTPRNNKPIPENCLWIPLFNGITGSTGIGCMLYWPNMLNISDSPNYLDLNKLGVQLITNWLQITKRAQDRNSYNFMPLNMINNPFYNERYALYLTGWGKHLVMPGKLNNGATKESYNELFKNYTYNYVTKKLFQLPATVINAMELKKWDVQMYWALQYYASMPCIVNNIDVVTSMDDVTISNTQLLEEYEDDEEKMKELTDRIPINQGTKHEDIFMNILESNFKYNLRIRNIDHYNKLTLYSYLIRMLFLREKVFAMDTTRARQDITELQDDYEQRFADILDSLDTEGKNNLEMEYEQD